MESISPMTDFDITKKIVRVDAWWNYLYQMLTIPINAKICHKIIFNVCILFWHMVFYCR